MINCMISLDLKDAESGERAKFDKEMLRESWTKAEGIDTVWTQAISPSEANDNFPRYFDDWVKAFVPSIGIPRIVWMMQVGDRPAVRGEYIKKVTAGQIKQAVVFTKPIID